jgi:hypothetical protein
MTGAERQAAYALRQKKLLADLLRKAGPAPKAKPPMTTAERQARFRRRRKRLIAALKK